MTEKELLYCEDAINHEKNIIEYCNDAISNIDDKEIANFFNSQIKKHKSIEEKITKKLEDLSNE